MHEVAVFAEIEVFYVAAVLGHLEKLLHLTLSPAEKIDGAVVCSDCQHRSIW